MFGKIYIAIKLFILMNKKGVVLLVVIIIAAVVVAGGISSYFYFKFRANLDSGSSLSFPQEFNTIAEKMASIQSVNWSFNGYSKGALGQLSVSGKGVYVQPDKMEIRTMISGLTSKELIYGNKTYSQEPFSNQWTVNEGSSSNAVVPLYYFKAADPETLIDNGTSLYKDRTVRQFIFEVDNQRMLDLYKELGMDLNSNQKDWVKNSYYKVSLWVYDDNLIAKQLIDYNQNKIGTGSVILQIFDKYNGQFVISPPNVTSSSLDEEKLIEGLFSAMYS